MSLLDLRSQHIVSALTSHPLKWLFFWIAIHVLSRLWASPALELDEAEQMLWSQHLQWGYGEQPPLYTWLQWGASTLLGPTLLSLAVLKFSILGLTFFFVWRVASQWLPDKAAWLASASMVWLPIMGWESLRDLTHTILVTCLVAATWWALVKHIKRPSPASFVLLGVLLALGLLSKYSFALFGCALGLAVLSLRETRNAFFSRHWWLMPLTTILVLFPHLLWLLENWTLASGSTLNKFQLNHENAVWTGLSSLTSGVFANLLLWGLAVSIIFGRHWWHPAHSDAVKNYPTWTYPLFRRYLGALMALLLMMVLIGGVSHFKGRWLHPLLCMVPMMVFVWKPHVALLGRSNHFILATAMLAALLWGLVTSRPWLNGRLDRLNEINEPIVALAQHLNEAGYVDGNSIMTSDRVMAGMLRTQFPLTSVSVCPPEKETIVTCVEAQVARNHSSTKNQYWIVTRKVTPPSTWWTSNPKWEPIKPIETVPLAYVHAPDGAMPMTYKYFAFKVERDPLDR